MVIDLETLTPGKRPDMRVDVIERAGWLRDCDDMAYWSECTHMMPHAVSYIVHNGMYDFGILSRDPWFKPESLRSLKIEDTMAAAYCAGEMDLSLKGCSAHNLGITTIMHSQKEIVGDEQYHGQDLWLTRQLLPVLKNKLHGTAYAVDCAVIPALIECSYTGYEVDPDRLRQALVKTSLTRERAKAKFEQFVEGQSVQRSNRKVKSTKKWKATYQGEGEPPNEHTETTFGPPEIGSPKQLQRYFDVDTTEDKALTRLVQAGGDRGLAAILIQTFRGADKLLSTYFEPLVTRDADGEIESIAPNLSGLFNITPDEDWHGGTGTGRLSSERWNMQNLTDDLEVCLRAPDGFVLLRGDFPQVELRAAAEWSDDPYMLEVLSDPTRDMHRETRDYFELCQCGPVKCIHRDRAKRFNFGVLYGAEEQFMAEVMACPIEKARQLRNHHRKLWKRYYEKADEHWAEVQRTGYSEGMEPFRHRRYIPITGIGGHAFKQAINHPPQNYASYLTKVAMTRIFSSGQRMVNQIHDAIHTFVPVDQDPERAKQRMKDIMEETLREFLPRAGNAEVEVKASRYWEG
jgi:hypothetical protein